LVPNDIHEFKATTQRGRDAEEVKAQAVRQAQLYAYAFKRPNIKAQVAHFQLSRDAFPIKVGDLPKPEVTTISRPASDDEALTILEDFDHAFHIPKVRSQLDAYQEWIVVTQQDEIKKLVEQFVRERMGRS